VVACDAPPHLARPDCLRRRGDAWQLPRRGRSDSSVGEAVFRLFVSSPGDVAAERARAEAVVEKLNAEFKDRARLDAVFWEDHFYSADKTFQDQIPEAAECHLALAIFRARLGSPLAGSVAVVGALAIGMGAAVTMFGTCSSSAQHKRLSFGWSPTPKANWLAAGGAIYDIPVGIVLGIVIGLAVLLTERWSEKLVADAVKL